MVFWRMRVVCGFFNLVVFSVFLFVDKISQKKANLFYIATHVQ